MLTLMSSLDLLAVDSFLCTGTARLKHAKCFSLSQFVISDWILFDLNGKPDNLLKIIDHLSISFQVMASDCFQVVEAPNALSPGIHWCTDYTEQILVSCSYSVQHSLIEWTSWCHDSSINSLLVFVLLSFIVLVKLVFGLWHCAIVDCLMLKLW